MVLNERDNEATRTRSPWSKDARTECPGPFAALVSGAAASERPTRYAAKATPTPKPVALWREEKRLADIVLFRTDIVLAVEDKFFQDDRKTSWLGPPQLVRAY